jgi:uncharacterized membrane protein YbhN (UPF0104 family)
MANAKTSFSFRRLHPFIAVAALTIAGYLIYRALHRYSFDDIVASLAAISSMNLAIGAAFAAGSYLCLTGFDTLAVRYTKSDLPYRKIALASFISLSLGHTLGFSALSSGAVRYRFYSGWGLSAGDIARIIVFCGLTVVVGLCTLGGIATLSQPRVIAQIFGVAPALIVALGIALLGLTIVYLGLAAFTRWPLRIWHFRIPLPPFHLAIGQVVIGTLDFLLVSAALHQMLLASSEIGILPVIYFLIPFVIGSMLLGATELARRRRRAATG